MFVQLSPPFIERLMTPLSPDIKPKLLFKKYTQSKFEVTFVTF